MNIKLWVKVRTQILDPQGTAVLGVLHDMGYDSCRKVRVGKLIEIELDETDQAKAEQIVAKMAEDLLANWVMEDYEILP